jgi:hypothetical protein
MTATLGLERLPRPIATLLAEAATTCSYSPANSTRSFTATHPRWTRSRAAKKPATESSTISLPPQATANASDWTVHD